MSDQVNETRRGPGVFISYRRGETAGQARALHELLEQRLGEGRVFMDVDAIALGEVFVDKIGEAIASSGVTLVLIGNDWFNETNKARLFQNEDFIRLEIEMALQRRVPIIPILIERAAMPKSEELPEQLRPLTSFQALDLENQRWDFDVNRLITAVVSLVSRAPQTVPVVGKPHEPPAPHRVLTPTAPPPPDPAKEVAKKGPSRKLVAIIAAAVVVVVAVVAVVALLPKNKNNKTTPPAPKSALVSASGPVSKINPDRLVDQLTQASFDTADLPGDVTASAATLSVFRVQGLVAPVLFPMSGPANLISVNYAVFANQGDASQYYTTYEASPSGYVTKGSFTASGIGDPVKCLRSFGSKFSAWASSCAVLSGTVVTFVQVQDTQNEPKVDSPLAVKMTRAGISNLRKVATSSPSATPVAPPGNLSPAALYTEIDSKVGSLPFDVTATNATIGQFSIGSSPPPGLEQSSYDSVSIPGPDGYGDSQDYVQYYVFDNDADASSWYGTTGLIPGSTSVRVASIDSSGFTQPANCATYTIPSTSSSPEYGAASCSILDGDVIIATRTLLQSTTAFGDQDLAVMLARQAMINVDLADGA